MGLDAAGKTTTLYHLHLGEAVKTQPTVGSNVEQITYKNLHFEVRRASAAGFAPRPWLASASAERGARCRFGTWVARPT